MPRPRRASALGVLALLALLVGPGEAPGGETDSALGPAFVIGALTFRAIGSGMEIESVTGSGRPEDPFVVTERILGDGPAVLAIDGMDESLGNLVRTHHLTGFALVKHAVNATGHVWLGYRIELQEQLGVDSSFFDGLSFGQGAVGDRGIGSDRFESAQVIDEPLDAIVFTQGAVPPGEAASFSFMVTDTSPIARIYLVQRGEQMVSGMPGGLGEPVWADGRTVMDTPLVAPGTFGHIALP